jgi:hypothetical protein
MSVDTPAGTSNAGAATAPAAVPPRPRRTDTSLREALRGGLFPDPGPAAPPTRGAIAAGAIAVLVATALSLSRTRGPGALNSIWAEDGRNFLADALNLSVVDALTAPFNGYWHTGPRILAEVASRFPIEWAPGVLSAEAALVTSVLSLIVYVASGPYLRHPALRLLAAVPAALPAAGIGWVENNVATLQFPMLYGLFWTLLWVPRTVWGRLIAICVVPFVAFSTPLAVLFVPLALARLALRRDWLAAALGAGLLAGVALQFGGTAVGWTTRAGIGTPRYDPIWAIGDYLTKLVPTAVFGEKWTFDRMEQGVCPQFVVSHPGDHALLVGASWLVVAAVVVLGIRRCQPAWPLAVVAAGYSVLLYSATVMTLGCAANRYFVAPALMLLTAIAALLRPAVHAPSDEAPADRAASGNAATGAAAGGAAEARRGRLTTGAVVFLTLAAIVCAANLRSDSPRADSPRWSDLVDTAREQCAAAEHPPTVVITTTIPNWTMRVKCTALD